MPIVNINTIKEWFSNQKKPPQEQFWAWLDSFYHKWEGIAISGITGLTEALQKKADLVDGVVPESQLPFSVVTSEVIALGPVSIAGNTVNLPVHSSGANKVRVKGQLITRTFPNQWLFTEIVGDGYKVLRGYAVKGEDDFFLAESAELPEITDPEIPENALELFRFTISAAGVVLDQDDSNGYKQVAEDPFRNIVITNDSPLTVGIGGSPSSSFNLTVSWTSAAPKIGGIRTKFKKNTRDGHEVTFYNDSDKPVTFMPGAYTDGGDFTDYGFAAEFVLKPGTYQKFKRRNNLYEVMGGGGSADFPEANTGDVLVKGAEVWEGSSRLTDVENEIDAEVVNRALADALKLDKPTAPNNVPARVINADGSTSDKGDFQLSEQIEISTSQTAQDAWKGKEIWVTASCTLTIPAPSALSAAWNIDILVFPSVTLTLAITSGGAWLHTTPGTVTDAFFRIARRGSTTTFKTLGL